MLFAFFLVGAVGSLLAWGILLTAVCSTPQAHAPDGLHTVAYSCHGLTVFMSSFEAFLRLWLIPLGMFFTVLSVIAGVMVAVSTGKLRLTVTVRLEDSSQGKPKDPAQG